MRLDSETIDFAVALFSSFANATRLRMIDLLAERELTVNEVAQQLGISQPNASQHLAILQRNGVVKVTPKGTQRYYSIRGPRIARILTLADEFCEVHSSDILKAAQMDGVGSDGAPTDDAAEPMRRTRHRKVMPLASIANAALRRGPQIAEGHAG